MSKLTVQGAQLVCTQGKAPCALIVPAPPVTGESHVAANIFDNVPNVNIPGFSVCTAIGIPKPCKPAFPGPWAPGSPNVLIRGKPALRNDCKLQCAIGGTVSIVLPGQATVNLN